MKDENLIKDIKERYKEADEGWRDIYDEATDDMRFVYDVDGGQWPAELRKERADDRRPVLTINKILKFMRQVRGDHLMNQPGMDVIPVDSKSDPAKAKIYASLIREIEYLSSAEIAYDTAYQHALSSSIGFFRLVTQYSDDDTFDQDIRIKRVVNPMCVHLDPRAKEFNFEDGKYAFYEELVDAADFKRLYPGADAVDFESKQTSALFGDWMSGEKIRVAEYFYKDPVETTLYLLDTGDVVTAENDRPLRELADLGVNVVRQRTVQSHVVRWCKTNGAQIIKKGEWPGKYIPIIAVLGDEIVVNGRRYYLSLARGAKDPQRMYNYWATSGTEVVALAPKSPFILDYRQIDGFENEWEEANRKNRMFIRYKHIPGLNKPSREQPAQIPTAIMSMMNQTAFDIEDHLGRYEASKGQASNERSGKAIATRIAQSDLGTYVFNDNFKRALIYAGRQIIDLIPKVYQTERLIRIRDEEGIESVVGINVPGVDENGQATVLNDMSVGKYDIVATVGPAFATKRQEVVQNMIEAMQYAPMLAPVIAPFIFKFSDFPGSDELYREITQQVKAMQQQQEMAPQQ